MFEDFLNQESVYSNLNAKGLFDFFKSFAFDLDELISLDGHLLTLAGIMYHSPVLWLAGASSILFTSSLGTTAFYKGVNYVRAAYLKSKEQAN